MLLDIIIPVHNVNNYIRKCINSVIKIEDANILVINDGSKEDCSFLKEEYSKFSNFYYYEKENGGLSSARNYGLERATSEYVMFLDGDDFVDGEKLELALQKIKSEKKIGYFFFFKYYYEKDNIYEEEVKVRFDNNEYISILQENFDDDMFLMVAWRYIIKRQFLVENFLYFTPGIYYEDEEWTARLFCKLDKIYSLNEYIYFYRQREGSISSSNWSFKHILDLLKIVEKLDMFEKSVTKSVIRKYIEKRKKILFGESCVRSLYVHMSKSERKEYISFYNKERKRIKFKKKILGYYPYWILRVRLILKNKFMKG